MTDIGFDYIPANQRVPGVYPEVEGDIPGQPPQWTLMVGQSLISQATVPIKISSVATAVRRFGAGSMLASMVERYLASDPNGSLWVLPLDDFSNMHATVGVTASSGQITGLPANTVNGMGISGTGIPSSSTVTSYNPNTGNATLSGSGVYTGSATSLDVVLSGGGEPATGSIDFGTDKPTEDGAIYLYIAGRLVTVPIAQKTATADIATAVAAAINGYFDANDLGFKKRQRSFLGVSMPVSATVSNHTVTLTANHAGYVGNGIDIQLNYYGTSGQQETPAGMTITITAMSGGAVDPVTSGLDSLLGDTQYDFIVQPYTTTQALNDFQTMMSDSTGRWSPMRKVYGHVFSAMSFGANGSNATTFGVTRNDRHMTIVAYENGSPAPAYDVAASYCGAFASSSRIDPARPTQSLAVVDILAPHRHERFSNATRQTLLGTGLALMDYNPDYTSNILRAVTTYQLDENGTPDIAYRDTETLYTLMAVVRQMTEDWGASFPRAKILDDDVAFGPGSSFTAGLPDQAIVTIKSGKAVLIASYARMATGKGQSVWLTDLDQFKQGLVLQRNSSDPTRLDALLPVVLASGLRVTAMKVDFALQGNS
jgi:phage tail sheath gpL-like